MPLKKLYPGRLSISPQEANFAVFGYCAQTTNNQLLENRFKLPLAVLDGKRVVWLDELQQFIDANRNQQVKRRGPKTKAEKLVAMGDEHA